MLIEIQSDVFKTDLVHLRPEIVFKEGLNIILGESNAENSIGKSLFLMIIDSCFGGKDYHIKPEIHKNIIENVGDHLIKFAFKFNDEIHYFSRPYSSYNTVNICDSNYRVTKQITLDDFNLLLKNYYKIAESPFRKAVSKYFRIYSRGAIVANEPLKDYYNQNKSDQITDLIKLFNKFNDIEVAHDKLDTLSKTKKASDDAQKYNIIYTISKAKYEQNLNEINTLKEQFNQLEEALKLGKDEVDELTAQSIAALDEELSKYRQAKYNLSRKIKKIDEQLSSSPSFLNKEFKKLKNYFNEIDVDKVKEVESFHNSISSILAKELLERRESLNDELNLVNTQISDIQSELTKLSPNHNKLDLEAIRQHHSISDKIKLLEDENKKYLAVSKLKLDVTTAKKELADIQNIIDSDISNLINEKIIELSKQYFPYDNKIPYLLIESPSKYNFFTPADIGAGTNYKGIILLDLAIRELTQLPVLIHDSNLFKNLSNRRIDGIFKTYIRSQKQTFISFDKAISYSQETQQIITEKTRLSLSAEERLYGKIFDIHKEEKKND